MLGHGANLPEDHFPITDADDTTSYGGLNYGVIRARKAVENHGSYRNWNSFGDFGADRKTVDDEDSGFFSPPLWRTSPQGSRSRNRSLSPSERAQAIARGQKELMEMVSRMPEGCYELSLKDIVEQPMVDDKQESSCIQERSTSNKDVGHRGEKEKRRKDSKTVQLNSKESRMQNNGGHLLKMVFPVPWRSSKKKKSSVSAMSDVVKDGRVSPKPLLYGGSDKSVDEEWWKKRYSDEGEESAESGGFSSNGGSSKSIRSSSSSSSRNSSRHGTGGCWCFLFPRRARQRNK